MVVLCTSQVDVARANFHSIQQAECTFSACVVSILAKAVTLGVLLARLFNQVETLKSAVSLQQVLDLVFGVLFGKPADE